MCKDGAMRSSNGQPQTEARVADVAGVRVAGAVNYEEDYKARARNELTNARLAWDRALIQAMTSLGHVCSHPSRDTLLMLKSTVQMMENDWVRKLEIEAQYRNAL